MALTTMQATILSIRSRCCLKWLLPILCSSVRFRFTQKTLLKQKLADSIYTAIKGGADFTALAKKYGQTGESNWISSANYENAQVDGDNLKFISTINNLGVNELSNVALGQGNIILQVTDKKAVKDKYKVAVIKRAVEFSKETYNKFL